MGRLLLFACVIAAGQTWEMQDSGTTASLRGISAASAKVAWASGAKGTVLRTTDGGSTWQNVSPPNAADLDFRDVEGFNDRVAFAMSAGEGRASQIYKTTDGGTTWTMLRTNQDPAGFWDAIAMWDPTHGILLGDPVDGRFTILVTNDGVTWTQIEGPKSQKDEAAFAASGTALIVRGTREAWFATGGLGGGRVFHSDDAGKSWTVARTPIQPTTEGIGIFSLAANANSIVAVGGDYKQPSETKANVAIWIEGKWIAPLTSPGGYRSAVVYVPQRKIWIATGTSGSDISDANAVTWRGFDDGAFHALSVAPDSAVWAVGPEGRVARLTF